MSERFGLDYAWAHISPAELHRAGVSFVCRYLSDSGKDLGLQEARVLRGAGIDIIVVWETSATRSLDGEHAGAVDARAALAEATRLGLPAHRPIFFAIDYDELSWENGAVDAYFRGVNSVLGVERTGVYGDADVADHLVAAGLVRWVWQTYAWSAGRVSRHANLLQFSNDHTIAGVGVDFDRALTEDFGQWGFEPEVRIAEPDGRWHFTGWVEMPQGAWHIEGAPGENVVLGGHDRVWGAAIGVEEKTGAWTISSEPFKA